MGHANHHQCPTNNRQWTCRWSWWVCWCWLPWSVFFWQQYTAGPATIVLLAMTAVGQLSLSIPLRLKSKKNKRDTQISRIEKCRVGYSRECHWPLWSKIPTSKNTLAPNTRRALLDLHDLSLEVNSTFALVNCFFSYRFFLLFSTLWSSRILYCSSRSDSGTTTLGHQSSTLNLLPNNWSVGSEYYHSFSLESNLRSRLVWSLKQTFIGQALPTVSPNQSLELWTLLTQYTLPKLTVFMLHPHNKDFSFHWRNRVYHQPALH